MSNINPKIKENSLGLKTATCDRSDCDHCLDATATGDPCLVWYKVRILSLEALVAEMQLKLNTIIPKVRIGNPPPMPGSGR